MPSKRDRDATHANKLLRLFAKLFFNDREYSLTELSEMLECSKQTVLRLVDAIEESMGLDVERTRRGNRSFFRLPRRRAVPAVKLLSHEELQALHMCAAFAESLLGRELFDEATMGLEKTSVLLPVEQPPSEEHFATLSGGHVDYGEHADTLRLLIEAMEEKRVCRVRYRRLLADRERTFNVKPLKIFSYRDCIYLHTRRAREPGQPWKEPKYHPLLAVHRIQWIDKTDQVFRVPDNYDFERDVKAGFGVWQNEPFRVRCRFTGWAAEYVAERRWSPDQVVEQRSDRSIVLEFTARGRPEVVSWILGFGPNARVLEPTDMVDEVRAQMEQALAGYGDEDALDDRSQSA
ncbi:MAG TPA: WYL domain-containing protein [Candidatus Krumholzibacteria bacterium]|nr:WYL domain-containing protein [Candidatus Krumholzibacteria bacterium]